MPDKYASGVESGLGPLSAPLCDGPETDAFEELVREPMATGRASRGSVELWQFRLDLRYLVTHWQRREFVIL